MKESFVIRYFKGMVSPKKIVETRSKLNWIQLVIIFLFLMALLLTPFSLQTTAQENQLKQALPHAMNLVTKQDLSDLNQMKIQNQQKTGRLFANKRNQNVVASVNQNGWNWLNIRHHNGTDYQLTGYRNAIIFGPRYLLVTDQNGKGVMMRYPTKKVARFQSKDEVVQFVSQNWFNNHRLTMQLMFLFIETSIIAALMLLITIGASAIFDLTCRHKLSGQHRIRQSVAIVLLSAGLPTIVAMVLGVMCKDAMFGLQVQAALWVLYLVLAFWKLAAPKVSVNRELKKMVWRGE